MVSRDWPHEVFRSDGEQLELHSRVGEGGEGRVFHVGGHSEWVVKLHKIQEGHNSYDFAKLEYLLSLGNPDLFQVAAWPLDLVYDQKETPIGFLMQHLIGYTPIYSAYQIRSRMARLPGWSYAHLIRSARNLCACIATLHEQDVIVGDLNESNVLVSPGCKVMLLDVDSFQVTIDGQVFAPDVARSEYLPPELQGQSLAGQTRTKHGDCFSMAVLLFQLLLFGRHPFAGRPRTDDEDVPLEMAITEGWFAYTEERFVPLQPPSPLSLNYIPRVLRPLFEATFNPSGLRPSAGEWYAALDGLEKELTPCKESSAHFYIGEECPWCRLETVWKTPVFTQVKLPALASESAVLSVPPLLFDVSQYKGIILELPPPEKYVQRTLKPRLIWRFLKPGFLHHMVAACAVLYGGPLIHLITGSLLSGYAFGIGIAFACYCPLIYRWVALSPCRKKLARFFRQWSSCASIQLIEAKRKAMVDIMSHSIQIEHNRNLHRAAELRRKYPNQIRNHLSRYSIAAASHTVEDVARIENLMKRGLCSAADVDRDKILKMMPRMPYIAELLCRWAFEIELNFWNQCNLALDAETERQIQATYEGTVSRLKEDYELAYQELCKSIEQVRKNQRDLLPIYDVLCEDVAAKLEQLGMQSSASILPPQFRSQIA